jgi:hypothetical protein
MFESISRNMGRENRVLADFKIIEDYLKKK